jgi:GTPase SAR1 family protein
LIFNFTEFKSFYFYDISIASKQSLEELIPIYRQIIEVKAGEENIPILLVGNKCDDGLTREVSSDFVIDLINKVMKGCAFIETSAKTSINVYEAFQVSSQLMQNLL